MNGFGAAFVTRRLAPATEGWVLRHVANLLTVLRILLAAPVVLLVLEEARFARPAAAVLFIVAALTDLLDGYLARRSGRVSALGAFLDPLADKLLVDGALVALAVRGEVPYLLAAFFLARDTGVTLLRALGRNRRARLRPGVLAKLKTASISAGAALLLLATATEGTAREMIVAPAWIVIGLAVLLTLASVVEYGARLLSRRATPERTAPRPEGRPSRRHSYASRVANAGGVTTRSAPGATTNAPGTCPATSPSSDTAWGRGHSIRNRDTW
jgi:CDP-diacylglycerol--glycerol-3-phosphate 3-phosphatidyltransferase